MNYMYWLANVQGIGNRTKWRLFAQTGSAEELYFLPEEQLKMLDGMDEKILQAILKGRKQDMEEAYLRMCEKGITFLSMEDPAYPQKLKQIPDPPLGLYVKGRLPSQEQKTVAIVGARMCSEYGRAVAKELGKRLAAMDVCIVSGMARGIDAAGHTGALEASGMTCAVLGCGVDVCYPSSHRKLYGDILEKGSIVSEYPPETQPLPALFPQRNRIISGMSDVVVVVEAKERSGSLITADQALEQGKDIYAVPGRIFDPLSAGCNNLIRQGAGMISNVEEFLKELDLCRLVNGTQEIFEKLLLEKEESLVYSCVDLRPKNVEELLQKTRLDMPRMAQILASLVQKGFITETFKNCYIRRI